MRYYLQEGGGAGGRKFPGGRHRRGLDPAPMEAPRKHHGAEHWAQRRVPWARVWLTRRRPSFPELRGIGRCQSVSLGQGLSGKLTPSCGQNLGRVFKRKRGWGFCSLALPRDWPLVSSESPLHRAGQSSSGPWCLVPSSEGNPPGEWCCSRLHSPRVGVT